MGCGCGSDPAQENIRAKYSAPSRDGGYYLASYPECSQLYRGKLEGLSVIVVGRLTDKERLFPRSGLAEASTYVRETKRETGELLDLESLPTAQLCQDAVVAVLG